MAIAVAVANFALGNFALGNLALGNLALGNLALGDFALGDFTLGNLALRDFALGNLALRDFTCGNSPFGFAVGGNWGGNLAAIDFFLEPLRSGFVQRALAVAVLTGLLCAVAGSYLLVQRMALLGDAISHSVLAGVAIAFLLGANIFIGAFVAGVLSTLAVDVIRTRTPIKEDAAMGIVLSAFFALGIVLITAIQKDNKIDLNHFLFGNILAVTAADVRDTAIVTVVVLVAVVLLFKELQFYTFDKLGAQAAGLPVRLMDFGLTMAIALTIVASLKAVGVVLVLSMLIAPPATAYLLVTRLPAMMALGAGFGIAASVLGMGASYYLNLPSGPAIVLVASGFFLLALLFSPRHGLLTRPRKSGDRPDGRK